MLGGEIHQLNRILHTIKIHLPTLEVDYVAFQKCPDVKKIWFDISTRNHTLEFIEFEEIKDN
jgi:hypothetical protein